MSESARAVLMRKTQCACGRMLVMVPVHGHAPVRNCPLGEACEHQRNRERNRFYHRRASERHRLGYIDLPKHAPITDGPHRSPAESLAPIPIELPPLTPCAKCGGHEVFDRQSFLDSNGFRVRISCAQCQGDRWADVIVMIPA